MIVVADASPLNYLLQINREFLLPSLYRRVTIPSAVLDELAAPGAPDRVRAWVGCLPDWIRSEQVSRLNIAHSIRLDLGESCALQLARNLGADLVLMNDRKGAAVAADLGLQVTGTLGILLAGQAKGLTNALVAYEQLMLQTNFRLTAKVEEIFLNQVSSL